MKIFLFEMSHHMAIIVSGYLSILKVLGGVVEALDILLIQRSG